MRTAFTFLILSLGTLPAFAQDTYDLRGPAPVKGSVITENSTFSMKDATMTMKINGQEISINMKVTATGQEEKTIQEVQGRDVTKYRTKVQKADNNVVTSFGGMEMKENKPGSLVGEIILSEKKNGKWKHLLVDGQPSDEQKKELDKLTGIENDDEAFPKEKVKVGHAWEVDASKLKSLTGNQFTDVSGTIKQKFLRIEKIDGEDCAVIESSGTMKGKLKLDDDMGSPEGSMTIKGIGWKSLKTGYEVKGEFEGTMKFAGKMKIMGEEVDMTMEGPITGKTSVKVK
jgi:hypothetical protein